MMGFEATGVLSYSLGQIKTLSGLQYLSHPRSTPAFLSLPIELAAYVKGDIQCLTSPNVVHLNGELIY